MQYLQIILYLSIDTKLTEILLKEHAEMFIINPDKYQMGIQRFIEEETLDELFQSLHCTYEGYIQMHTYERT
jgi:hypothetical protein